MDANPQGEKIPGKSNLKIPDSEGGVEVEKNKY